ncbi:hypothetical protein Tco_1233398 [Tanacetum coccineum]
MQTEMELTLEQIQQGVSYEVSNIRVILFTMKMEILLEPTSNKLMVEHAEFDESDTHVLERLNISAGNPVKEILLKLNLPDHRNLRLTANVVLFDVLVVPEYSDSLMSLHKLIKDSKLFVGFDETKLLGFLI